MNQKLKKRIQTAIVLGIIIFAIIFKGNDWLFALLGAIFMAGGAFEWGNFINQKYQSKLIFSVSVLLIIVFLWHEFPLGLNLIIGFSKPYHLVAQSAFILTGVWWLLTIIWLPFFPKKTTKIFNNKIFVALCGLLILSTAWQAWYFFAPNRHLLILVILIISTADTGAYFSGKLFGKTKLATNISPKKTLEGALGGLLLSLLVGFLFLNFYEIWQWQYLIIIPIVVVVSILGDLTISTYKRHNDLKDTGNLLPGHGGILDRSDSFLSAAPIFVIFSQILL